VDSAVGETLALGADPRPNFDEFFDAEYPRLVRVLGPIGTGAEDAVQEAFTQAALRWRRVSRYDDPAGWVRRVAVNRMLNERRRVSRHERAVERLAAREEDAPDADASIDLTAAIRALPRQQRIAIALFYGAGLSSADTGEAMGISAGAVRFHIHEARKTLRARLEVDDE